MGAIFGQAPILQHRNVLAADGHGDPLGDDDGGAPRQLAHQGLLDFSLRMGVQRTGAVIQQKHPRVAEQGPRQGQALPLSS